MKNHQFQQYRQYVVMLCSIGIIQLMSGCIAAELGLGAEAIGATDLIGTEALVGTEDATLLARGLTVNSAGEVSVANTESLNSLLGKVRLEKVYGESPKLYIEGKSQPFAEVYAESGKIRMLGTNKFYAIPDNIFSVNGETVNIRMDAIKTSRIVTTVKQGNLLVKLAEKNGWYQVKLVQNSTVYYGWINALYAVPLILVSNRKKEENGLAGSFETQIVARNQSSYSAPTDNSPQYRQGKDGYITEIPKIGAEKSNYHKENYSAPNPLNVSRGRAFNDIKTPFRCNCTFTANTRLSTTSSGEFAILDNITFIINTNGRHTGNIYLYKNATLVVNGRLMGNVINNGGTIIQNSPINGHIIDNSNR